MFLLIILGLAWLAYKWSVSNFDYFDKIGLEYEKPLPLVGNMLNLIMGKQSMIDLTKGSYEKFKKSKIYGFFNFKQTAYFITDPELIRKITIKDFDHFVNHNENLTKVDRIFDRTLFALHNKEWRDMRSTLSPIFTSSKMKMMYCLLSDQATDFVKFYDEKAKKGDKLVFDLKDVFMRFTADGISTAVLGFQADCVRNKDSDIFKMVEKLLHDFTGPIGSTKFLFSFVLPQLYQFLNIQVMSAEIYNFFKRVVVDVMNERDQKKISRPDVIQLLLQARKGQLQVNDKDDVNESELANFSANVEYDLGSKSKVGSQFNDDDWIAQGFIFFGAGFDTTSNLLQAICYELAFETDMQRDLHEEIDAVAATLDNKPISYEALHKMKFLDMVVSEGLRKWAPAPQIDRSCSKDYDIDLGNGKTVTIKKGQVVFFPMHHLHRDPNYFKNPEKFDPYRFSDENKDSIIPGTYFPFGLGPRTCIGSRFALMEAKLLLFNFMSKFSVAKCDQTPAALSYEANLNFKIKETVYLKFIYRK